MSKRAPGLLSVLLLATPCLAGDRPPPDPATKPLFVANCAQCHGEKGDGEGVTQLDRKARSFLEGGFSYGNTKDAILRSITHGIPGTPMPSFEKALSVEQRAALADYVIALGPERLVVDPSESEMIVKDKPLVVRGKLPALVEGGLEIPRGIAIGTPDGLTFEYRADDVQLVRVRAGRFLNRADWGERGGAALEMLGKPIWTSSHECNPGFLSLAQFRDGLPQRLAPRRARLLATSMHDGQALVEYELAVGEGEQARSAVVRESCRAFRNALGSGFRIQSTLRAKNPNTWALVGDWPNDAICWSGSYSSLHGASSGKPWLALDRSSLQTGPQSGGIGQCRVYALDPTADRMLDIIVLTELAAPVDVSDPTAVDRVLKEFSL